MLFQYVDVEALVPPNHHLRKIDAVLDLSCARGSGRVLRAVGVAVA